MIRLSVLLCTHDPNRERLQLCVGALARQTLDRRLWELVVIDNASRVPLQRCAFLPVCSGDLRIIREPELGLTPARIAGIAAAVGDVLVFVDDDNVLAQDYLESALDLMQREPRVGAAGGIVEGCFEVDPPRWIRGYLDLLGIRNFGDRPIQALVYNQVGPWEPIGAGMVIRSDVARHYAELAKQPLRRQLDRRGSSLGSCGDTDMARCAPELGYFLAYEPSLYLQHLIPAFRLRYSYMMRLVRALKRSGILLDRLRTDYPAYSVSPIHLLIYLLVRSLRQFHPDLRIWLLRVTALTGEFEAWVIQLSDQKDYSL